MPQLSSWSPDDGKKISVECTREYETWIEDKMGVKVLKVEK